MDPASDISLSAQLLYAPCRRSDHKRSDVYKNKKDYFLHASLGIVGAFPPFIRLTIFFHNYPFQKSFENVCE